MNRPLSRFGALAYAFAVTTAASLTLLGPVGCSSDGGGSSSGGDGNAAFGADKSTNTASATPTCDSFYAAGGCCETLASQVAAAVDQCHQAKQAIVDGIKAGATAAQYETACKQALSTAQQIGKCK